MYHTIVLDIIIRLSGGRSNALARGGRAGRLRTLMGPLLGRSVSAWAEQHGGNNVCVKTCIWCCMDCPFKRFTLDPPTPSCS